MTSPDGDESGHGKACNHLYRNNSGTARQNFESTYCACKCQRPVLYLIVTAPCAVLGAQHLTSPPSQVESLLSMFDPLASGEGK